MSESKSNMYLQLIEGYELSLEIETDKNKIKMYRDLIEGYKLALELEEEGEEIKEEIKTEPIKINENTSIKQLLQAEGFQILNNGIVKYNDVEVIMWLQRKYLIKKGENYIVEVGSPNEPYDKADMGLKIALLDNIENKSNRNKGNASFVLDKIVQASDLTNTTIQLIPQQMDKKGLTEKQLIEWYKKRGFEFNEDGIVMERKPNAKKEVIVEEPIQEVISEEVAKNDFQPTYLMTLDEYREKVTPIIQAYKKFLRKNKDWFVKPEYSGIAHYSLEEALEQIDDEDSAFAPTTKYSTYKNKKEKEKSIRENYSYKKTRKHDDKYTQEPTPPNLITENKEYIEKLKKYFSTDDLNSRVDDDETKSNKRAVRRAIDDDIYKELLTNKKVQLIELQKVADSVGVRLPKSIFDKSTQNQMKYEEELGKLLSNIPILSFEKLKELIKQIKVDLIPLEELVYEQEYARYSELIKKNIGTTKKAESFGVVIPVWSLVYNYESEYRKENTAYKDWKGEYYTESVEYVKLNKLKSDWEKQLENYLKEYVANLKNSIIIAIMRNFQSINMPIKSIERLTIEVGKKGFEGSYKFTFENGSSFIMNFQGVGAGGYNIQSYHFRYLTNFSNVKLADGSKGGTNYYEIVDKFSTKR